MHESNIRVSYASGLHQARGDYISITIYILMGFIQALSDSFSSTRLAMRPSAGAMFYHFQQFGVLAAAIDPPGHGADATPPGLVTLNDYARPSRMP
jgi:hypothetical protein